MKPFRVVIFEKRVIIAAFVVLVFTSATIILGAKTAAIPVTGMSSHGRVVIDPGHGGIDGGTGSGKLLEKDINLDIAQRLKDILENRGYEVIMTRESDISLDKLNSSSSSRHKRDLIARVDIINTGNADLFLSIHVNSNFNRPSNDGSIVFFHRGSDKSSALAGHVQHSLNSVRTGDRPRTANQPLGGRYYVLANTKIPGVLIETAFISNPTENELLKTRKFRQKLAEAIAEGTVAYFTTTLSSPSISFSS